VAEVLHATTQLKVLPSMTVAIREHHALPVGWVTRSSPLAVEPPPRPVAEHITSLTQGVPDGAVMYNLHGGSEICTHDLQRLIGNG